jgi:hypothetical protein
MKPQISKVDTGAIATEDLKPGLEPTAQPDTCHKAMSDSLIHAGTLPQGHDFFETDTTD